MLYEKLLSTYRRSNCDAAFPLPMLNSLESFISEQLEQNRRLISPYKYALLVGIEIRVAIQFFLYFAQEDGIFKIRYFFDCPKEPCGDRIYLPKEALNNVEDQYVTCQECGKEYSLKDVVHYIKVYFEIEPNTLISINPIDLSNLNDPNSTYFILKGVPDHLKVQSPSPSVKRALSTRDEGDSSVDIFTVIDVNYRPDGKPISDNMGILVSMANYTRR